MKELVVLDYSLESMSRQFTYECDTEDKIPIPIWPCIKPKRLLPRNQLEEGLPTQDAVDLIIKKYVDQQLFYTPFSKPDLQKFVMSAEEI
eukprot:1169097-Ditylum_brightwellii.AAC.1